MNIMKSSFIFLSLIIGRIYVGRPAEIEKICDKKKEIMSVIERYVDNISPIEKLSPVILVNNKMEMRLEKKSERKKVHE